MTFEHIGHFTFVLELIFRTILMKSSVESSSDFPFDDVAAGTDKDNEIDRSGGEERSPAFPCLDFAGRGVTCLGEAFCVPFAEQSIMCLRTIFS
jgi:hypothetical protein